MSTHANNEPLLRATTVPASTLAVSVISTVRNEAAEIDRLVASLMAQTLLPAEVIIVDRIYGWNLGTAPDSKIEVPEPHSHPR